MTEMSFFIHAFLKEFKITPTNQIPKMVALLTLRPDKVILNIERMGAWVYTGVAGLQS